MYKWPEQVLVEVPEGGFRNSSHDLRDALVIVYTKDSLTRLAQSLPTAVLADVVTLVLDDSCSPDTSKWIMDWPQVVYHGKDEQRRILPVTADLGLSEFVSPLGESEWRLGQLRNYGLVLASIMGKNRLLMIDDDVVICDPGLIVETFSLLSTYPIVGANTIGMRDYSITGHIESIVGTPPLTFISGQYMGVDLSAVHWSFPAIYNEDWIFALMHATQRPVARCGAVRQLEYDLAKEAIYRAIFQEPGEVICEGVAEMLLEGLSERQLYEEAFWADILGYRWKLHEDTYSRAEEGTWMKTVLYRAMQLSSRMRSRDCVDLISSYLAAQPRWRRGFGLIERQAAARPK